MLLLMELCKRDTFGGGGKGGECSLFMPSLALLLATLWEHSDVVFKNVVGGAALQHVFDVDVFDVVVTQQNRLLAHAYRNWPVHVVIEQLVFVRLMFVKVCWRRYSLAGTLLEMVALPEYLLGSVLLPLWKAVAVLNIMHPLKGP